MKVAHAYAAVLVAVLGSATSHSTSRNDADEVTSPNKVGHFRLSDQQLHCAR
jgi:hypothetical protein